MTESSGASFPGFGSEEIRNLPATEIVTGTEELTQATMTLALADPDEVSVKQASSVAPSLGDSRADQSSLIIQLNPEELRSGLGRRSHHSEREDSGSSPSSQEDSHSVPSSSCPRSIRHRSPAPISPFR